MKLQEKIALITGGNSGIGLATAKLFQKEGAKVIITGRRKEVVDNAVKEIGGEAIGFASDTSNLEHIDHLYAQIKELYGRIDVLYLNAGIAKFEPMEIVTEERFDELSNTNFKGLFFNAQKALPLMEHGASIIITTSAAAQIGSPNMSVYGATKAAARNLARTLSGDLLRKGIRVNGISPGPIDTPIMHKVGIPEEALDEVKEGFAAENPMKRIGTADEIAKAALFLASDDSSYIAGVDLAVDGGLTQL
ncbi:SDR family oxidoreductase [Aquimarina sp. LLG6339-5]|uniref:SDR family oxidoreductase n=1 Tax=Aquimarina sp. LLG6339-5 TaxID=3160830 RepID=UPI00386D2991